MKGKHSQALDSWNSHLLLCTLIWLPWAFDLILVIILYLFTIMLDTVLFNVIVKKSCVSVQNVNAQNLCACVPAMHLLSELNLRQNWPKVSSVDGI